MESSFFEHVINVERYIEDHDAVDERVLRRHFELSETDFKAVLAWLAFRGLVALRTRNGHRVVTPAHQGVLR